MRTLAVIGPLTCLQLANSKIYQESFPPVQNFAKIIFCGAFLMELDPKAFLYWPHPVYDFGLKVCHFLHF